MNVAPIPTRANADALWNRYAALVKEAQDNPALMLDREHAQAMILAHRDFADAFLKTARPC